MSPRHLTPEQHAAAGNLYRRTIQARRAAREYRRAFLHDHGPERPDSAAHLCDALLTYLHPWLDE